MSNLERYYNDSDVTYLKHHKVLKFKMSIEELSAFLGICVSIFKDTKISSVDFCFHIACIKNSLIDIVNGLDIYQSTGRISEKAHVFFGFEHIGKLDSLKSVYDGKRKRLRGISNTLGTYLEYAYCLCKKSESKFWSLDGPINTIIGDYLHQLSCFLEYLRCLFSQPVLSEIIEGIDN